MLNNSNMNIVDLPDDVLFMLFKMMNNIELLCSIIGVNRRLDMFACDGSVASCIDLTQMLFYDLTDSPLNEKFIRFSTMVLPRIHCTIVNLIIRGPMHKHVFRYTT